MILIDLTKFMQWTPIISASLISIIRNQSDRNKVDLILNEINPKSFDSIPDPYYGDGDGFQKVYNMLNEVCDMCLNN